MLQYIFIGVLVILKGDDFLIYVFEKDGVIFYQKMISENGRLIIKPPIEAILAVCSLSL